MLIDFDSEVHTPNFFPHFVNIDDDLSGKGLFFGKKAGIVPF